MQDFRNLKVWQKGHSLTIEMYKVTENFLVVNYMG